MKLYFKRGFSLLTLEVYLWATLNMQSKSKVGYQA
jgi:hypothetical protein